MECRVWVAAVWLTHCADALFVEMNPKVEVGETMARVAATRELATGIAPHSPERWAFWKRRLSELSSKVRDLEMDDSVVERLEEALEAMKSVEDEAKAGKAEGADVGGEESDTVMEAPGGGEAEPALEMKGSGGGKAEPTLEMKGPAEGEVNTAQRVIAKDSVGS